MVDVNILKDRNITVERLKEIFTAKEGKDHDIAENIRNIIRTRIDSGISHNLCNYHYWHACDIAWDTPFRQTTPTLVRHFVDNKFKPESILEALRGFDISDMIRVYDKSGNYLAAVTNPSDVGQVIVSAPAFFHIFIPLCKAYTTIRAAAIVNAFRQVPLFSYAPAKFTKQNRIKADLITDRVEIMSTQYGYYDVIRQAVLHMLHYSQAFLFPMEEWHHSPQLRYVKGKKEPEMVVVKEGVRFHIPHPSRTFYDTVHRPSTLNSDTGISYAGYWKIGRFGDFAENPAYWNVDCVSYGDKNIMTSNPMFFNTVYSSCALRFPDGMIGDKRDREQRIYYDYSNDKDRAVTHTEYFERLNPKKIGIGDYDYDVWFRFVIASSDTVMYATPLPYSPPIPYFGYDALETRAINPSMTLEILPFQDHISNLFTQAILLMKQNLANVTFYDTNQVSKSVVDQIDNLGNSLYTKLNLAPIDLRKNRMGQNNIGEAFKTFEFSKNSPNQLMMGVRELLEVLERMMVFSPQELAQTAAHEITAEEVRNMNQARSTRFEFTMGSVDRGVHALKTLLYQGLMAYGEDDIYSRMPMPVDRKTLEDLGFTIEDGEDPNSKEVYVRGKKSALDLESFASTRDADLRINNTAAATSMTQMLAIILNNPVLLESVGVPQVIKFINEVSQLAGLPREFKFTTEVSKLPMEQQAEELQKHVVEMGKAVQANIEQTITKEIVPYMTEETKRVNSIEQLLMDLAQKVDALIQPPIPNVNPLNPVPPAAPPIMDPAMAGIPAPLPGAGIPGL